MNMIHGCQKGFWALLVIIFTLSACTHPNPPTRPTAYDQMHRELQSDIHTDNKIAAGSFAVPARVSNALMPPLSHPLEGPMARVRDRGHLERHFDISTNKMPAKAFFMGLVEGTPYNMVLAPKVAGEISVNLKNVTIAEAMDVVRDMYGYEYKRTSFGFEVLPQELVTQIFNVNYLNIKRTGTSYTQISSGQISEKVGTSSTGATGSVAPVVSQPEKSSGSSIDTRNKMDFWRELEVTLTSMVGKDEGRSVQVDAQAGIVIARAYPGELHRLANYLERIQSSMNRQVVLEAKILEVQLNDEFQAGVDWNLFGQAALGTGGVAQTSSAGITDVDYPNLTDFTSIFTLRVLGDFGALIKLLQLQGQVQVLSSPRISTVNNQKAVIKVGNDAFYVTGVSTSNSVVGTNTLPSENVDLTPFFSGITLDVTPQISRQREVILHIHPTISNVSEEQKNIVLGSTPSTTGGAAVPNTFSLPLAKSTIRESDNVVRAKSGQIIVIGGLMQSTMQDQVAGVPWLSRLPGIGPMFRRTYQVSEKSELVILLRPIITDNRTWGDDLKNTDRRMSKLDRGFHESSLHETFGSEAESEDYH